MQFTGRIECALCFAELYTVALEQYDPSVVAEHIKSRIAFESWNSIRDCVAKIISEMKVQEPQRWEFILLALIVSKALKQEVDLETAMRKASIASTGPAFILNV